MSVTENANEQLLSSEAGRVLVGCTIDLVPAVAAEGDA
jgi:hypothetical protein